MSGPVPEQHLTTSTIDPAGYLRLPGVRQLVPVCASTIWKWVAEGKFPAPVKLSARTTAWRAADILIWLNERANAAAGDESKRPR